MADAMEIALQKKACMLSYLPGTSPSCTRAWQRGWSKLAARERRYSRCSGRNSAAPVIVVQAWVRHKVMFLTLP